MTRASAIMGWNHGWAVSILLICLFSSAPAARAQTSGYAAAEASIRAGQFDEGIRLLTPILAAQPRSAEAHNLLGIALTGKRDLAAANTEYNEALRIRPGFVPALKNLAINELALNDEPAALQHFHAALKLAPQDPVLHAYLGKIAFARRDYRIASGHLEKTKELLHDPSVASELIESDLELHEPQKAKELAAQIDPGKLAPEWRFRLGLVLARHDLFQEAIPFFERVDATSPQSWDAGFNLAVCYLETKQFSRAVEVLRALATRGPKTAELDTLLAEAYEGNQQTQEAVDTLREAAQLAPEDENSFVNLTALCTKYEAYDVGLQVLEAGLHYHPHSDRLIFQRGVIYALTNQFTLAEKDFQLASSLAPENNLNYAALGVNYMQAGDPAKAIASLRERVAQKPGDATLQFLLGESLMRTGPAPDSPEFAEAQVALEKAAALDPHAVEPRVELAKVYIKKDRIADSVRILEQARALDPNSAAVYLQLVIAYRRDGKPEAAAAALAQLNQLNADEGKHHPNRQRLRMVEENAPRDAAQ